MIQILLIHNKFSPLEPITYLSYGIRVVTCSKWNHVAIRINDRVIESKGDGVTIVSYSEWESRSNRIVLPMIPKEDTNLYLDEVLFTEGEAYGFLDLVQMLRRIKAEKWDGKAVVNLTDKKGLICSDLACILLGIPKTSMPSDFEFNELLIKGEEYTTSRI